MSKPLRLFQDICGIAEHPNWSIKMQLVQIVKEYSRLVNDLLTMVTIGVAILKAS